MKEKIIKSPNEILSHPETYRRVWTVELRGKLIEGLWRVLDLPLFIYYKNGELFLTDNQEEG